MPFNLSHADKWMVLGSCFAENTGQRLQESGFQVSLNPFGVLYNPASVGMALYRLLANQSFRDEELVEHEGYFHSFSHHGSFSGTDRRATLERINQAFDQAVLDLEDATCLMITFGTAWVYALPSTDQIVANCHKLPEDRFIRRRLTSDEIVYFFTELFEKLFERKPDLKVVFTVSPIRHWKDGVHENTVSKAILHMAIEELQACFDNIAYFPAFELVVDDLRDYRFYADDMLHPSAVAQRYVWDHFSESFFHKATKEAIRQVQQIRKAMQHKPFHPGDEAHVRFAKKYVAAIEMLRISAPELDLTNEMTYFARIIDQSR
jgi:lysophospholipase L1-like esterase